MRQHLYKESLKKKLWKIKFFSEYLTLPDVAHLIKYAYHAFIMHLGTFLRLLHGFYWKKWNSCFEAPCSSLEWTREHGHKIIFVFSKNGWEKQTTLKKKKTTKNVVCSHKAILCFKNCSGFKNSPKNKWGLFYQMDHNWWAPSKLKKSLGLIVYE